MSVPEPTKQSASVKCAYVQHPVRISWRPVRERLNELKPQKGEKFTLSGTQVVISHGDESVVIPLTNVLWVELG